MKSLVVISFLKLSARLFSFASHLGASLSVNVFDAARGCRPVLISCFASALVEGSGVLLKRFCFFGVGVGVGIGLGRVFYLSVQFILRNN